MKVLFKSRTLSVSISCNPQTVYEFVSNPENLPKWAKALCRSVRKSNDAWIVETPPGAVKFRFVSKNDFGVLDHYVKLTAGVEVVVPMRVVPNGSGSEVLFTLFQLPDVSDEKYAEDIQLVEQDLKNLKGVLER